MICVHIAVVMCRVWRWYSGSALLFCCWIWMNFAVLTWKRLSRLLLYFYLTRTLTCLQGLVINVATVTSSCQADLCWADRFLCIVLFTAEFHHCVALPTVFGWKYQMQCILLSKNAKFSTMPSTTKSFIAAKLRPNWCQKWVIAKFKDIFHISLILNKATCCTGDFVLLWRCVSRQIYSF